MGPLAVVIERGVHGETFSTVKLSARVQQSTRPVSSAHRVQCTSRTMHISLRRTLGASTHLPSADAPAKSTGCRRARQPQSWSRKRSTCLCPWLARTRTCPSNRSPTRGKSIAALRPARGRHAWEGGGHVSWSARVPARVHQALDPGQHCHTAGGGTGAGSGGGSGSYGSGSGGSGIVILRYPSGYTISGLSGTTTTVGTDRVTTFTSGTGNIQFN